MHDTALEIGRLAIEIYAGKKAKILELGAMDVNGSLRQFAPEGSRYIGVDLEPGKSVDLVVKPGKPLPFEDGAFDLILASSVFEHDPAFWATFLDLARLLKIGGYMYINAPSNGKVHRYPEDHWRFYPDSGLALERWATSQKTPVRLVESFTAPRKGDMWNDFVAVFRRGKKEGGLKGRYLHTSFGGKNVWTMGAENPLYPYEPTEDMVLLDTAHKKLRSIEAQMEEQSASIQKAAADAHTLESTLRQREEEIAQISSERSELEENAKAQRAELAKALNELQKQHEALTEERNALRETISAEQARFEEQTKALNHQQKECLRLEDEKTKAQAALAASEAILVDREALVRKQEKALSRLRTRHNQETEARKEAKRELKETEKQFQQKQAETDRAREALGEAENSIENRFKELATLTQMLNEAENNNREAQSRVQSAETRSRDADTRARAAEARSQQSEMEHQSVQALCRSVSEQRIWLTQVHAHLAEMKFWTALLPPKMRAQKRLQHLKGAGLFDGDKYLELYPDVIEAGMDPLRHYILHGMEEGRERPV